MSPRLRRSLVRAVDGHADLGWRLEPANRSLPLQPHRTSARANRSSSKTHADSRRTRMSEQYCIIGEPCGEPLPPGRVGVRVRIPLSGCPSRRWSRDLSARLATELVGRPGIGHLRLNEVIQGDHIVLEGVEKREASALAGALRRAVTATNRQCPSDPEPASNVAAEKADAIAHEF
jgi:hypothetical protein